MKRPLATFGAGYLLASLLAVFMPQTASLLLAAFFALPVFLLLRFRGVVAQYAAVLGAGLSLALLLHMGYDALHVAPLRQYEAAETPVQISGIVFAPQPTGAGDSVRANVKIDCINGAALPRAFLAQIRNLPPAQTGQRVSVPALLFSVEDDRYAASLYADGVFMTGVCVTDAFAEEGIASMPSVWLMRLRERLGAKIRTLLPYDIGAIAAAMSIGDKTALSPQVSERYRAAGLSHVLVVSGMHLSILCGIVSQFLRGRMRRKYSALLCCVTAVLFMAVSGFTPSLVRAGVCTLLMYSAVLVNRRSDTLTSLAFSAVLLCLQNPYAAADVGLLLSYSATLGVLYANGLLRRWACRVQPKTGGERLRYHIAALLGVPVATAFFTLPIQIAIGGGVSLLTVLCNVLAAPLLSIIVVSGILTAVFGFATWLVPLLRAAGLVCGVAVKALEAVAQTAQAFPFALVHITGAGAVCICLCAGAWVALGHQTGRRVRVTAATTCLFLLLGMGMYAVADANVVRVALIGGGQNPCVVVTQRMKTMVLYRGPDANLRALKTYLTRQNRSRVELLIDLRTGAPDTEYLAQQLHAQQTISAEKDVVHHRVSDAFYDIMVKTYHQAEGNIVYCNVQGYTFAAAAGKIDFTGHPPLQLYLAGSGAPQNLRCEEILLPATTPLWVKESQTSARMLYGEWQPILQLRAGRSIEMKEVETQYAVG